jgi:hypothetical protein
MQKMEEAIRCAHLHKSEEGIYMGTQSEVHYFLSLIEDYSTIPDNTGLYEIIYDKRMVKVKIM